MAPQVTAAARAAVLDTIGAILAGAREPVTGIVAEAVAEDGARPVAAQLGAALRTSAEGAALVNATSGHALDYDDVSISVRGHPSVVVLPAALAVAQSVRASGRALLEAYVAGVEVTAKLGRVRWAVPRPRAGCPDWMRAASRTPWRSPSPRPPAAARTSGR